MHPTIESAAPVTVEQFFPHFADGGGYTTQVIFFSGTPAEPASGDMRLYTQSGATLSLSLTN